MSDNKRNGRSFNGTGYYIALILCAAAIGISGYLYHRNTTKAQEVALRQTEPQQVHAEASLPPQDVPVMVTEPQTIPTQPPAAEPQKKVLKTMAPVAGEEAAGFCVEALSYNETTRDWRVHNGVDITAQEGTEVRAAADGKVYTTFEDDTLGHTVVIVHDGGYATRYSSLREDLRVTAGDQVTMGQPIGYVGTTALVESVMGPHVHFSVSYRDTPMDPADFLALG